MVKKSETHARTLFGTDGIRGVANSYPMTSEVALKLGRALTTLLKAETAQPKIIVGKDTRLSGYMLETAFTSGVTSMGGYALLLGPLPTPAVSYLIRGMRAQGGVMISASHNPYQDNGLKVFGPDGFKLDDALETKLEKWMMTEDEVTAVRPSPDHLGRARRIDDAMGRYLTNLKTIFGRDFDLKDKKIVFDGANGAAYDCGVKLFEELGATVHALNCKPNGKNINVECALTHPQILSKAILEYGADIGIAVDGDADRLYIFDETGELISGEHILYALALFLRDAGRLSLRSSSTDAVATTTMSNQALEIALKDQKIQLYRTQVGDRYVTEVMRQHDLVLGGENSGHYLFLDQNTTGDGLFSALEILALLHKKRQPASSLKKSFSLFPQQLASVKVRERIPFENVPKLHKAITTLESHYKGVGRVNVRYSGTESLLRVMVEGPDQKRVEKDVRELVEIARTELG